MSNQELIAEARRIADKHSGAEIGVLWNTCNDRALCEKLSALDALSESEAVQDA